MPKVWGIFGENLHCEPGRSTRPDNVVERASAEEVDAEGSEGVEIRHPSSLASTEEFWCGIGRHAGVREASTPSLHGVSKTGEHWLTVATHPEHCRPKIAVNHVGFVERHECSTDHDRKRDSEAKR
jgi:hypothetical protein